VILLDVLLLVIGEQIVIEKVTQGINSMCYSKYDSYNYSTICVSKEGMFLSTFVLPDPKARFSS